MKTVLYIKRTQLILLIPTVIILICLYCFRLKFNVETACHYIENDDDLPSIESHRGLSVKHIYFHETSCNGALDAYQACAVESAARYHPSWQINVIFSSPVNKIRRSVKDLRQIPNIKYWRMHLNQYLHMTPLQFLVTDRLLKTSNFSFALTQKLVRYATLYKWDGVYLDLNILIVKPLDLMPPNFATRIVYDSVSDGILAFSNDNVGRYIAEAAIRDVADTFALNLDSTETMTRVLTDYCNMYEMENILEPSFFCNMFYVFGPNFIYPVTWRRSSQFSVPQFIQNPFLYGYCLGDNDSISNPSLATKFAIYSILAKRHCPFTYTKYNEDF